LDERDGIRDAEGEDDDGEGEDLFNEDLLE
jgi:hypothetical protein